MLEQSELGTLRCRIVGRQEACELCLDLYLLFEKSPNSGVQGWIGAESRRFLRLDTQVALDGGDG